MVVFRVAAWGCVRRRFLVAGLRSAARLLAPAAAQGHRRHAPVAAGQDEASFTGQTAAFLTVDLVARVAGFLQEAKVIDGADVQQGQVLFVIEPRPVRGAGRPRAGARSSSTRRCLQERRGRVRAPANPSEAGGLDAGELRQGPRQPRFRARRRRRGAGEPEAGADQSRLHQGHGSVRRSHRPPPGRSRQSRRRRQRDQARNPLEIDRSTPTSRSTSATCRACGRPWRDNRPDPRGLRKVPVFAGLSNDEARRTRGASTSSTPDSTPRPEPCRRGPSSTTRTAAHAGPVRAPAHSARPGQSGQPCAGAAIAADQIGPYVLIVDEGGIVAIRGSSSAAAGAA